MPVDSLNWCGTQVKFEQQLRAIGYDPAAAAALACPEYGPCDDPVTRDVWIPDTNVPIVRIRLAIHILAYSDGSYPFSSPAAVQAAVDSVNRHYLSSRIQFDYVYDQVNSTEWRLLGESEIDQMKTLSAWDPTRWLNVWVTNVEYGYSFGTFPFEPDALEATGGIVMGHFHWGGNFSPFAHELGHCLGLWHTFHGVSEVDRCGPCYESVVSSDRDDLGDLCSDTPPSPTWYQCSNASDIDSCSGLSWGSTQPENYMGYTPNSCRSLFTLQQRGRMQCWIDNVLSGWKSGVLIQSDTIFGKAPLPVQLNALTFRQVDSWNWDLGDQTAASDQPVSHTYDQPGVYSVGVAIQTPDGPFTDFVPDLVWVQDDTISVARIYAKPQEPIRVEIRIHNFVPISEIILPVLWSAENELQFDSMSTVGLRGSDFELQTVMDNDNTARRVAIHLTPSLDGQGPLLEPGDGPVMALFFTAPADLSDTTDIQIMAYDQYSPFISCPVAEYTPQYVGGAVLTGSCCRGRVGDTNNSGEDEPTLGDVSVLIDMLYISTTPVPCLAEADINQSGGPDPTANDITIGDISALIDYLFITGPSVGLRACL